MAKKIVDRSNFILQIGSMIWSVALAFLLMYSNRHFYHDDSYITLRYVNNYLAGLGIVWNPGEYVQGYTNFLHLMLISLLGSIGIDLVWASRIIGLAALIALAFVVFQFKKIFNFSDIMSFLPLILVITSSPMLIWSIAGLEGTLFSFLVATGHLLFLLAMDAPRNAHRFFTTSGIVFGLGYLTRPDGALFIAVSFSLLIWMQITDDKKKLSNLILFAAGVFVIVAPYSIWQFFYYGDIVPNTFYAKTGVPLKVCIKSGFRYFLKYAMHPPFLPFITLFSIIRALLKRHWNCKLAYLSLSVSSYIMFLVLAGGDHMPSFRLVLPIIPLMSIILAASLFQTRNTRFTASVFMVSIILTTGLQILDPESNPRKLDPAAIVGAIVGKYIETAWPSGSLVALNTAGSTPYFAEKHLFIDMLGLNDRIIAQRKIDILELEWQLIPGHLKGDGNYVLSRKPDYVILGPADGREVFVPIGMKTPMPWFLSDLELSRNPDFAEHYTLERVFLEGDGHAIVEGGFHFTYYKRLQDNGSR